MACTLAAGLLLGASQAQARPTPLEPSPSASQAPAGQVEWAFSPRGGCEALVLRVIASAHREIKVLAYSFTSAQVTRALLAKAKAGVSVAVVADAKANTSEDRSGKAQAALSALANAGVDVRLISAYAIHHDKSIVVDGQTVETGSFNYSLAAEERNSENVIVHWANPALATAYLQHFRRNYDLSKPFKAAY